MGSTLLHLNNDTMKSMLLYSTDNLFTYACKARFKNICQIDMVSSTSAAQTLTEKNSYDIAIFDILFMGQCDNLIRYLSNANTRIIAIVATQEQERYYTSCQSKLGINRVFRKPVTSKHYHLIINDIE